MYIDICIYIYTLLSYTTHMNIYYTHYIFIYIEQVYLL